MSRFSFLRIGGGAVLLLIAGRTAEAQHARLYVGTVPSPTGQTRELVCRGKPGIDLRVEQDPSPRRADHVAMVLRYERPKEVRSVGQEGMGTVDYGRSVQFIPGSCTWNSGGFEGVPPEPGVVYFDLPRDAQTHAGAGQRDTTVNAAVAFPDLVSVPRYLSDSSRFWLFYVNDATNVSISFRSSELLTQGSIIDVAGSLRDAAPGSATLSSARVLSDSASRMRVVRTPDTAGGVGGPLRGSGAGSATASSTTVLRDSVINRSPSTKAPAPAPPASDGGSLRGGTPTSVPGVRTSGSLPADGGVAQARPAPGNDTLLSARAITAGSGPGDARTSRTLLPDVRIWGVATAPGSRGVRLVFNSDRAWVGIVNGIRVQFSRQRPPWDSVDGRWAYAPGWNSPWFADLSHPADGGYLAEPREQLEVRQRYYYLITVESNDRSLPPRQVVGSFIASTNPFAKAPPAPGPEPASNDDFGDPLRGDATDAAGALRDQPAGATTATGAKVRLPAAGASTSAGISRTRLPPDVRIWNIETRPGNNGVKLWFETDRVWVRGSSRGVRVQFSTRQPEWDGGLLVSPAVASEWREVTSGRFEAEPHWTLESGKRYYYLITVESNDASLRPRQATGSFLPAFR